MDSITLGSNVTPSEFMALRKAVNWGIPNLSQSEAGLNNSVYIVSAMHNGKTIGMCRIVGDHSFMFLVSDMMVFPEYQNRGIGNKIMEKIVKYIKTLPEGSSIGLMSARGREGFYSKFGFIIRPDDFYGHGMTFDPQLLEGNKK